jgi:holo-ACP synthase
MEYKRMEEYVTLEEMLAYREEKVRRQEELQNKHKNTVIVALGMNIPGPKKTSPAILKAFTAGTESLERSFAHEKIRVTEEAVMKEKAGYCKLYAADSPDACLVKKMTVCLEENHPLGRLYDIDVYDGNGRGVSREELGIAARRCLICNKDAKICGRNRSHGVEELYERVEEIIEIWLKEGGR